MPQRLRVRCKECGKLTEPRRPTLCSDCLEVLQADYLRDTQEERLQALRNRDAADT